MFDSLRLRLTVGHLLVLALLQITLCACIYVFIAIHLRRQADTFLESALTSMAGELAHQPQSGTLDVRVDQALRDLRHTDTPLAVYAADGSLLRERPTHAASITPLFARPVSGISYTQTPDMHRLRQGLRRVAVVRFVDPISGETLYLADSTSMFSRIDELRTARLAFLIGIPVMLLLNGIAGFTLSTRALQPALKMAERARTIGADNISERLETTRSGDELAQLALALNELLDRLAAAQTTQRQFMADAAHELRTPLSVAQTAVAVALLPGSDDDGESRSNLLLIDSHLKRLARSINDVFRLARADAGFGLVQRESIFLDEVLAESVHAAQMLARAKQITITLQPTLPVPCQGDEAMLQEMVLNLLENAIKYTAAKGRVDVRLSTDGDAARIALIDNGVGIDPTDRDRIFGRFYRGRPALSTAYETVEGTGLGLAIAQSIAALHGGRIELQSSSHAGSTFLIILPCASRTAAPADS